MNCENMTQKCPDCEIDIKETDFKCQNCGKQLKTKRLTKEEVEEILKSEDKKTVYNSKLEITPEFLDFWMTLKVELKNLITIQNWTANKKYYGKYFKAKFNQSNNKVEIYLPSDINQNDVNIVCKDFDANIDDFIIVYTKWNDYTQGNISRNTFNKSFKTKYTISIIHHIIKSNKIQPKSINPAP